MRLTVDRPVDLTPLPQEIRPLDGAPVAVSSAEVEDAGGADPEGVLSVAQALRAAGVIVAPAGADVDLVVRLGGAAIEELGVARPNGLPPGGYVLAASGASAALAGVDAAGTHHAAQSLRQLLARDERDAVLPAIAIRDWPAWPVRGVIEGFYGPPWSHGDRMEMLPFCGRHKLNTYVLAPKDDPYHRQRWREPYPDAEAEALAELVCAARQNYVELVYALAPGLSVCCSSEVELDLLLAKAEQLWQLGVRSFALLYDDIDDELRCPEDRERFGAEGSPGAAAHAYLANRFLHEFVERRERARRLVVCPTEYAGTNRSAYRDQLASTLSPDIIVFWTGPGIVPRTITGADCEAAVAAFSHDLLLWDNYPVNDFDASRLFLGPLRGRSPELGTCRHLLGTAANAMLQAAASQPALATVADFAWNPCAYDPDRSFAVAVRETGEVAADALTVLAEDAPRLLSVADALRRAHRAGGDRAAAARLLQMLSTVG